jgi:hypothetical protein
MKAVCDALSSDVQANNFMFWIKVDQETQFMQHLSEEDIATSEKNGKTTDALGPRDTGGYSEVNGDDSYEVVVPELSKDIENINEEMSCLEQQTNSEHHHLLYLVNIKQCVLKKCSHQF